MKLSKKHLYLPALAVAAGLFVYSALGGALGQAVVQTNALFASVSVGTSAAVDPNPYNTIAQQITDKEKELAAREKDISLRENSLIPTTQSQLPLYSFILSLVLTVLISINFYLDWRRGKISLRDIAPRAVINLRSR